MSKHDEARRAFLVGAAVGAGAAAGAALVPEALAQQQPAATNTAAPGHDHAAGSGSGYGAFLNDDEFGDDRGLRRAADAGRAGQAGRDAMRACSTTSISRSPAPIRTSRTSTAAACARSMPIARRPTRSRSRSLSAARAGRGDHRARARQGDGLHLADRAGVLQHAAHAHDGRHVRRPGLWRQQGLRRLAAGRLPRRAAGVHAEPTCRARRRSRARPSSACRRKPQRGGLEPWQPKRQMSSSSASARPAAFSRPSSARPA